MKYFILFLYLFLIRRFETNWQHISIQTCHISSAWELRLVVTILDSPGPIQRHATQWQGVFFWALRRFSDVTSINSHNSNPMKYYYLPFLMKNWGQNKLNKLTMAFQVLNDGAKIQIRLWPIFTLPSCFSHSIVLLQGATLTYSKGIISSIF